MDAVELLIGQHRRLEVLLKKVLDSQEPSARAGLLAQAGDELAVHIGAEEAVFYPAVHAVRTEDILLVLPWGRSQAPTVSSARCSAPSSCSAMRVSFKGWPSSTSEGPLPVPRRTSTCQLAPPRR